MRNTFLILCLFCAVLTTVSCQTQLVDLPTETTPPHPPTATISPNPTLTPNLEKTAIVQTLLGPSYDEEASRQTMFAPTAFVDAYLQTQTAHPMEIDPLILEFSGEYFSGGLTGPSLNLILEPNGIFQYKYSNDIGPNGRINGTLTVNNDSFILDPDILYGDPPRWELDFSDGLSDEEIIPLLWGEKRYLVPVDGITKFCNLVNLEYEPRALLWGSGLINTADLDKPAGGLDEFPEEIGWCILPEPITGLIIAQEEYQVTVDLGSNHRIFEGMYLEVLSNNHWCDIHIDSVSTEHSTGTLSSSCDLIEVGVTEVSSRR